jgi:predicted acyl esterase
VIIERKLMVPMRDGKRMATDVYRPKDASKKYPTIFVRTPYNFNFWDVRIGAPRDMPRVRYYTMGINKWQPMNTSNYFAAGHRIRLEVSSSNFPRFDRNLNTGGKNYDESQGVVAHNAVHHSRQYPSELKITVVKR